VTPKDEGTSMKNVRLLAADNASVGSSPTSCTYAVNYIQHDSNLYRLDWWGWDLRAQGERWKYNTSSLTLDISNYCSDQNNNS